ncbi:TauD/TfdA dioxygenase family protein [Paraburkholderia aspalathi]|uniref:Taurine dioxygenase n=1 Tax=Paraburkholderia aspalathi TaxID=1324617 RepID=A0A1I7B8S5_9BURK|nr:TauD/TfdA family dioxygenase [Paraburkholderia aspalathi]SFT83606.1 taurine dioxygenase [Paraburkholderia aspalathi]
MTLSFESTSPSLGAKVSGVAFDQVLDDAAASSELFDALRQALDRHLVLVFNQCDLSAQHIFRLAAGIGGGTPFVNIKLPDNPGAIHVPDRPEIKVISTEFTPSGLPLGDAGNTLAQVWHNDGAAEDVPPGVITFSGKRTPTPAPETSWMNMYEAYARLPDKLRNELAGLKAIYWKGGRSPYFEDFETPQTQPEAVRRSGVRHPLVCLHPSTHRPYLMVPMHRDTLIEGLSGQESRRIMDILWDHMFALECSWSYGISAGDVVIWDNMATMHSRQGWTSEEARTMWHLASRARRAPLPITELA